jgi:hypothetical protein
LASKVNVAEVQDSGLIAFKKSDGAGMAAFLVARELRIENCRKCSLLISLFLGVISMITTSQPLWPDVEEVMEDFAAVEAKMSESGRD